MKKLLSYKKCQQKIYYAKKKLNRIKNAKVNTPTTDTTMYTCISNEVNLLAIFFLHITWELDQTISVISFHSLVSPDGIPIVITTINI